VRSTPSRGSLTPDYRSVGHLRFSLCGILSLDIVCRSGFGWDCSLARCLLLLSWTTSWTVGMPRSEWIIALVIYHGAFTIAVSSLDWNLWMIAMLDLDAQPHSSRPAVSSRSSNSTKHCPNWANWGALRQVFRDLTSMEEPLKEWRKSRGNPKRMAQIARKPYLQKRLQPRKHRGSSRSTEFTPVPPTGGQNFPWYLDECWEFFAVLLIFTYYLRDFLLIVFSGNLIGNH